MRDIAEDAKCDPALIIRYFGSKDGLFTAAAEFDLDLPDLSGIEPSVRWRRLAAHFVDVWEPDGVPSGLVILLRSAATNEDARLRMRGIFASQVAPRLACDSGLTETQAALVSSHILGLALSRYILELPPIASLGRDDFAELAGRSLQALIDSATSSERPGKQPPTKQTY